MGSIIRLGDFPDYTEWTYNFFREIALIGRRISDVFDGTSSTSVLISGSERILLQKSFISALDLVEISGFCNTFCIWTSHSDLSNQDSVSRSLGRGIISGWSALSQQDLSWFANEILTINMPNNSDIKEFINSTFWGIASQFHGVNIIFVLDVEAYYDKNDLTDLVVMLNGVTRRLTGCRICFVYIVSSMNKISDELNSYTSSISIEINDADRSSVLSGISAAPKRRSGYEQLYSTLMLPSKFSGALGEGFNVAMHTHSLISPGATDYLFSRRKGQNDNLDSLLDHGLLFSTQRGSVGVSQLGHKVAKETNGSEYLSSLVGQLKLNTVKILSGFDPTKLIKLSNNSVMLADTLSPEYPLAESVAAFVSALAGNERKQIDSVQQRVSEILHNVSVASFLNPLLELDDLIQYLSQMCFEPQSKYERNVFRLVEELTVATNSADLGSDCETRWRRARRLTNLSYLGKFAIHARVSELPRLRRFTRAALDQMIDSDDEFSKGSQANYHIAWLLRDLGKHDSAARAMVCAAEYADTEGSRAIDDSWLRVYPRSLSSELAIQALAIDPESIGPSGEALIRQAVSAYGILCGVEDVRRIVRESQGKLQNWSVPPYLENYDCEIYFNRLDLGPALQIASHLVFDLGRTTRMHCMSDSFSRSYEFLSQAESVFIIGGPDTPGWIGDVIRYRFPWITSLWQQSYNTNLSYPMVQALDESRNLVVLAGSVFGDHLKAWEQYLSKYKYNIKGGNKMFESVILGSVLSLVLSGCSSKLRERLADVIVSGIKNLTTYNDTEDKLDAPAVLPLREAIVLSVRSSNPGLDLARSIDDLAVDASVKTAFLSLVRDDIIYDILNKSLHKINDEDIDSTELKRITKLAQDLARRESRMDLITPVEFDKYTRYMKSFGKLILDIDDIDTDRQTTARVNVVKFRELQSDILDIMFNFLDFAKVSSEKRMERSMSTRM